MVRVSFLRAAIFFACRETKYHPARPPTDPQTSMTGIRSSLRWPSPILRRTNVPPPESTPRPFTISRGAARGRGRAPTPVPRAARRGPATPPTGNLRPYRLASTPGRATSSPPHRPPLSPEGGPAMKDADVAPFARAPTGDANPSVGSTLLERLRAGQA